MGGRRGGEGSLHINTRMKAVGKGKGRANSQIITFLYFGMRD